MKTRFDEKNKDFTDRAHEAAREQVYPHLFSGDERITDFTWTAAEERGFLKELDTQYGVDLIIHVDVPEVGVNVPVYVQERFRRPEYRHNQDITVTTVNNASGQPSELGKIAAQQFVYGYYEPRLGEIQEAVCVNVPVMLRQIIDGRLVSGSKQNEKQQDFITIPFDELKESGALSLHLDRTQSSSAPVVVDQREDITAYGR